ncbi:hypothetical protein BpHYR1_019117 [Brachionus plicatilis]|uniref:Uncharacterized protein n=1 Tax=Brachionus plicatilis TaxID=10195 RepID=A0A3M7SCY7_BRAPC|nr:hypothetical protein BpHYR1_019117 [Brachionus plicatilis]
MVETKDLAILKIEIIIKKKSNNILFEKHNRKKNLKSKSLIFIEYFCFIYLSPQQSKRNKYILNQKKYQNYALIICFEIKIRSLNFNRIIYLLSKLTTIYDNTNFN